MSGPTLEKLLYDGCVYNAWQFVVNTKKTIYTVDYCRKTIIALIRQMEMEHADWTDSLFKQLGEQVSEDGKTRKISIRSGDLPQHKVSIVGEDAEVSFLLDKLTKDFFQYSRNAFDCMSQVVNAACLASKAKKLEKIDFGTMHEILNKATYSSNFPDMKVWYDKIAASPEFQYVDAFCNRTKHTCDVYLKISMALFSAENKTIINPFYRKEEQHSMQDLETYLATVYSFVETAFNQFIGILKTEIIKKTYVNGRYHLLKVYQQKIKNSPDSSFSVVYIDGTSPVTSMPEEIQVLLLHEYDDGEIVSQNSTIDTIYINDPTTKHTFLGKYIATESCGDDTLLRYRKYKRVDPIPGTLPVYAQAIIDPENHKMFYHSNPFMDITSVSDDDEFLARTQLPF